ncbi:MAG: FliG C-terminal domain-containing protein [bacterium]
MVIKRLLMLTFAGWLAVLFAMTALGQETGVQYVDSLEIYQRRIETVINERLASLFSGQQYVLRVAVKGVKTRVVPAQGPQTQLELPGFRISQGDFPQGTEKFKVENVTVRIVLNATADPTDLQYLRSIVPILADFRPERQDRLILRVIQPAPQSDAEREAEDKSAENVGDMAVGLEADAAEPAPGLGKTLFDIPWLLPALLGLILLILLIVMIRVFMPAKAEPPPAPVAVPMPTPPRDTSREDHLRLEEERLQIEQEKQLDALRHGVVKRLFARPELAGELIVKWQSSPDKLNALIHGVGPDISRQAVMEHVGRERYQEIEETVRQEKSPDIKELTETLREANLFLITQEITHPEVISPNPFSFLDTLTWGQINHLIKEEPVNVKAIVLSRLKSEDSARIMESIPQDLQLELAVQIGNLHDLPLEMARSVAIDLAEKAKKVPDARLVDVEGPATLVDVMGQTSPETSRSLLAGMKSKDTKLSEEVEKRFFLFDSITLVPNDVLPQAVRTMPSATVVTALQGASREIQTKVIMAFPEQARNGLVTALRASRADQDTVNEARRRVVAKFQELSKQGRVDLKQISDAWQAQAS